MSYSNGQIMVDGLTPQQQLADRLRRLRKANGVSLRQLADSVGTSASFLSQLERGVTGASTATLMRIANAYGCSIADLFAAADASQQPVLRRNDRPALPEVAGHRKMLLSRRPLTQLESYVSEFEPGASTGEEAYSHGDSHEMILVLFGRVEVDLGTTSHLLDEGDSIEFLSSVPHRVANAGESRASVLFVTSPPTSTAGYLDTFRSGKRTQPDPAKDAAKGPPLPVSG